jgi:hypothetical protein
VGAFVGLEIRGKFLGSGVLLSSVSLVAAYPVSVSRVYPMFANCGHSQAVTTAAGHYFLVASSHRPD